MRKTIHVLVPALLAATMLGSAATTAVAAADPPPAANLDLWSEHNQTGDLVQVPVPTEEACIPLDAEAEARSAQNHSSQFAAKLFTNDDCTGTPKETVGKNSKATFAKRHRVQSVFFVGS